MQYVEAAEEALGRRTSDRSPSPARRMCERHRQYTLVDIEAFEGLVEDLPPADADGAESDEIVLLLRLNHSLQRSEDVVADARPRMREGRDVVRDPHRAR
jgi:hypothetical protein